MSFDRNWMYHRLCENGYIRAEFCDGVKGFLEFAFTQLEYCSGDKIRCPCIRCDNQKFLDRDTVNVHLLRKGFTPGYSTWFAHGELLGEVPPISTSEVEVSRSMDVGYEHGEQYRTMVIEAMGPGGYVDKRSEAIMTKYSAEYSKKYGDACTSNAPPCDYDLWFEATGGPTHGHVYGFSPLEDLTGIIGQSSSSSTSTSQALELYTREDLLRILEHEKKKWQEEVLQKMREEIGFEPRPCRLGE